MTTSDAAANEGNLQPGVTLTINGLAVNADAGMTLV